MHSLRSALRLYVTITAAVSMYYISSCYISFIYPLFLSVFRQKLLHCLIFHSLCYILHVGLSNTCYIEIKSVYFLPFGYSSSTCQLSRLSPFSRNKSQRFGKPLIMHRIDFPITSENFCELSQIYLIYLYIASGNIPIEEYRRHAVSPFLTIPILETVELLSSSL